MKEAVQQFFKEIKTPFSWRRIWVIILALVVLVGITFAGAVAYAASYNGRVLSGVHIGDIAVGGMSHEELTDFLQNMNDKLVSDGIDMVFTISDQKHELTLYPVLVSNGESRELIHMDVDEAVDAIMSYGKSGDVLSRSISAIQTRFQKPRTSIHAITLDDNRIREAITEFITPHTQEPRDANILVRSLVPLRYDITTSAPGVVFSYDHVPAAIKQSWQELRMPAIELAARTQDPQVTEADVKEIESRLPALFTDGALSLTYTDPQSKASREWTIPNTIIGSWVRVLRSETGDPSFGFDMEAVRNYLETQVADTVRREPRDAKFRANEEGRVVEFQGSRPGLALDIEATYDALNTVLQQRMRHDEGTATSVQLVVEVVEPNVTTGEVNGLGIQEILGVGVSDFSGSPPNRIKNIANGVKKLNGIVIQPGEEFSAIDFTKPYTEEGGYLPELVIKGDEIKPEIGGGLCQIGTTLFRMAMNSGMEITARRNHSLVVSYYNDARNGLPGTDATIYEPAPDFRFRNDTKQAILIQADMDRKNQQLFFTLWGANDGRDGSYTAPVIKRWIPYGETKIVETTKLEPGKRECQHAYRGAEASFTYSRTLPTGEKEERVFESYYRPLPQICLVGVEKKATCSEGESCLSDEEKAALSQNQFNPDGSPIIPE